MTWLFSIPLALLGKEPMVFPYVILMMLGGLGPAIMMNFSRELFEFTEQARFYQTVLIFVVTIAVVFIWGPQTLTRPRGDDERS